MLGILLLTQLCTATEWQVCAEGCEFSDLAEAVARSEPEDGVFLGEGVFAGAAIPHNLSVLGESVTSSIISGQLVLAEGVTLRLGQLTLTGSQSPLVQTGANASLLLGGAWVANVTTTQGAAIMDFGPGSELLLAGSQLRDLVHRSGPVVRMPEGHLELLDSSVRRCRSGPGAVIEVSDGTVSVRRSVLQGNRGGGVGGVLSGPRSKVVVRRSALIDNQARDWGGHIDATRIEVYDSVLERGRARDGGALSARRLRVEDSMFRDNQAENGGAISVADGAVELVATTFDANQATIGGALRASSGASIRVEGCRFSDNSADVGGALAQLEGGELVVEGALFADNVAEKGGAIYRAGSGTSSLSAAHFVGNQATWGGGLKIHDGDQLSVSGSLFVGNLADEGGGLYVADTLEVDLGSSLWCGNDADTGGGLALLDAGSLELHHSYLLNNNAWLEGGALSTVGPATVRYSDLLGNTASSMAAWRIVDATAVLEDSLVAYNTSDDPVLQSELSGQQIDRNHWYRNRSADLAPPVQFGVGNSFGLPLLWSFGRQRCDDLDLGREGGSYAADKGPQADGGDDLDGDGWVAPWDCDEGDAGVNPDAVEVCDGRDNNCSGVIDDSTARSWYTDVDGDGFGVDASVALHCTRPLGTVSTGGDCDDDDAGISPGQHDIPNDGVDQDCDGGDDRAWATGGVCGCGGAAPSAGWPLLCALLGWRRRC